MPCCNLDIHVFKFTLLCKYSYIKVSMRTKKNKTETHSRSRRQENTPFRLRPRRWRGWDEGGHLSDARSPTSSISSSLELRPPLSCTNSTFLDASILPRF